MTQPLRPQAFTLIELPKAVSRSAALTRSKGFTLIELLVVITIIVVLLALLTPALDKAVYQAQLAVCAGSNLRSMATGVTQYAFDHKRRYPYRPYVDVPTPRRPEEIYIGPINDPGYWHDDRIPLAGYLPINQVFNCPMARAVELEQTDVDTMVYTNYSYWFGWRFGTGGRLLAGMSKVGDTFEWDVGKVNYKFKVLASDMEVVYNNAIQAAHPDKSEVLSNSTVEDGESEGNPVPSVIGKFTLSFWVAEQRTDRGLMDRNFAYGDGSVIRLGDLTVLKDARMTPVPDRANASGTERNYLPAN